MKSRRSKLIDEADRLFSLYIRLKYADDIGMVKCYTCGKKAHYKDGMQCGHFISRDCKVLRWDERNARVQCYRCNVALKGNYIEYTTRLIDEVGRKEVDKLKIINDRRNKTISIVDIENIISKLEKQLNEIRKI